MLRIAGLSDAAEIGDTDLKGAHGVFTWALLKVLWAVVAGRARGHIYQRARALVHPWRHSRLAMAGKDRTEKLLGSAGVSTATRLIPVREVVADGTITVGGDAMGLGEGTELTRSAWTRPQNQYHESHRTQCRRSHISEGAKGAKTCWRYVPTRPLGGAR